jgi:hypothetical protein
MPCRIPLLQGLSISCTVRSANIHESVHFRTQFDIGISPRCGSDMTPRPQMETRFTCHSGLQGNLVGTINRNRRNAVLRRPLNDAIGIGQVHKGVARGIHHPHNAYLLEN